ncbi:efflux RND transporter periplasmic adaptor subunit [Pseudoalteromonas sp. MMG012]|uniref:efflux RND transporter periplasmic adaptor subunit n=1 Tax=Pseudoalteromonas sp. MMG012 TaxID=2822686 RepID=UPI001B3A5EFD|nr:efflux RND transporter periplasmic adaptor subunit [Pseudoalteromonas sp. MMG012]MBQ4848958.1 efflux RND transporter periplasmic adaptor subunit [Pseudoalteromonas sp. MMG012]
MYQKVVLKLTCFSKFVLLAAGMMCNGVYAAVPVAVESIKQAPLTSQLALHGTLHGKQDVKLTAGIDGLLTHVIEPGTTVQKGEVLARIDTLPLEFEQARQQEMLTRAKINLRFHKQELSRLKKLAQSSSAAASQVDLVQNKHDLAQSDIALANIALKVIADKLHRATLVAPFSGVISARYMRSGKDINRADELLQLTDITNLEIRMYIPVKYLNYIKKGESLPFTAGNLDNPQASTAIITSIIPTTDPRSQSFEVRATLTRNTTQLWAVGQLVDVSVPLKTNSTTWLINRDALILRKEGVHIVKIDDKNTAHKIPVTVGKGQGTLVAITPISQGSLSIGDNVAVRGAERLKTGQEVEVQMVPSA